ncbi:hypothetical protein [Actinophytocola sp. KF-1]
MTTSRRTKAPRLALLAGFVAVNALAGSVLMAVGIVDLGNTVTARLPFESTAFAAIALAMVVGVPMAVVTILAATGDARTAEAAMIAGGLLVGWIGVQLALIRTFSLLQPVMLITGAAVFLAGATARPSGPRRR